MRVGGGRAGRGMDGGVIAAGQGRRFAPIPVMHHRSEIPSEAPSKLR